MKSLAFHLKVNKPVAAVVVDPDLVIDLEAATTYELASALVDRGWSWRLLPKTKVGRAALHIDHLVRGKLWYTMWDVLRSYLAVLFRADLCEFLGRRLSRIHHGRSMVFATSCSCC